MSNITIYQFTDPTCIWCWGNEPVLRAIDFLYEQRVNVEFIMGGLVEDITTLFEFDGPTPLVIERANARIYENWRKAAARHGMPISNEHMQLYTENYTSSFPQNVAYEAAKRIDKAKAKDFLRRIREATFTECKRTSQIDTLIELASEVDIDAAQFIDHYTYGGAQADFMQDRMKCRRHGITGFPSYLIREGDTNIILGGYQNLSTLHTIISRLSGGKVKPRKVGPSRANIMSFVKRYHSVYPVEIEVAFALDRARTDLIVEELIGDCRLTYQTIGDGRKLMPARSKATLHTTNNATKRKGTARVESPLSKSAATEAKSPKRRATTPKRGKKDGETVAGITPQPRSENRQ